MELRCSVFPTAQFPNIADPQIQVKATYVGADALTVEQSVATPIEQQMSGVDNMEYMYSLNANNGTMQLTVDFNIKTDANTIRFSPRCAKGKPLLSSHPPSTRTVSQFRNPPPPR